MLWQPFCSVEQNHFSNFGRGSPKEHFCEIILKLGYWPRRRYRLKVFLFFKRWWPFCSAVRNHFNNFDRGSPKEHSCEIISKSIHQFMRCHLRKSLTMDNPQWTTHAGHGAITIAHLEHSVLKCSGELKTIGKSLYNNNPEKQWMHTFTIWVFVDFLWTVWYIIIDLCHFSRYWTHDITSSFHTL